MQGTNFTSMPMLQLLGTHFGSSNPASFKLADFAFASILVAPLVPLPPSKEGGRTQPAGNMALSRVCSWAALQLGKGSLQF